MFRAATRSWRANPTLGSEVESTLPRRSGAVTPEKLQAAHCNGDGDLDDDVFVDGAASPERGGSNAALGRIATNARSVSVPRQCGVGVTPV